VPERHRWREAALAVPYPEAKAGRLSNKRRWGKPTMIHNPPNEKQETTASRHKVRRGRNVKSRISPIAGFCRLGGVPYVFPTSTTIGTMDYWYALKRVPDGSLAILVGGVSLFTPRGRPPASPRGPDDGFDRDFFTLGATRWGYDKLKTARPRDSTALSPFHHKALGPESNFNVLGFPSSPFASSIGRQWVRARTITFDAPRSIHTCFSSRG